MNSADKPQRLARLREFYRVRRDARLPPHWKANLPIWPSGRCHPADCSLAETGRKPSIPVRCWKRGLEAGVASTPGEASLEENPPARLYPFELQSHRNQKKMVEGLRRLRKVLEEATRTQPVSIKQKQKGAIR